MKNLLMQPCSSFIKEIKIQGDFLIYIYFSFVNCLLQKKKPT